MSRHTDQAPPHDLAAERAILCVTIDGGEIAEAWGLTPTDFYFDGHQKTFRAAQEIVAEGGTLDVVTLGDRLRRAGEVEVADRLPDLAVAIPTSANSSRWAEIVRDLSIRRQALVFSYRFADAARNGLATEDLLTRAGERLEGLRERLSVEPVGLLHGAAVIGELISGYLPEGLPTGIAALDRHFGSGLSPRSLVTIGGKPGRGKSTLANQIAAHNASRGNPVLFATLEDSIYRHVGAIVSRISGVNSREISAPGGYLNDRHDPAMSADSKQRDAERAYALFREEIDPHLVFSTEAKLSRLDATVRRWAATHKDSPHRLVIVDPIHAVLAEGDGAVERIDGAIRVLTSWRNDLGLTAIGTVHESRKGEAKWSSSFEFAADVRMRLEAFDPDDPARSDDLLDSYCAEHPIVSVDLAILKSKADGATGKVPLVFNKQTAAFAGREIES
jgi:replicative DNA helicase